MSLEPNGALIAFSAFTVAGAALGGTMLMVLGFERYRLLKSLRRGEDLTSSGQRLRRSLARLQPKPSAWAPHIEMQMLCAIISIEHADLASAEAQLANVHDQPAARALQARIAVLKGSFASRTVPTASEQLGRLGELIDIDTAAQIELASQRMPARLKSLMPTTRARVFAAQQKHGECLAILRSLAPCRVDAMCTLFPDDPATRLWLGRSAGPYR